MAALLYVYFMTYSDQLRLNIVCGACYNNLAPVKRDRLPRFRDKFIKRSDYSCSSTIFCTSSRWPHYPCNSV